MVILLPLSPKHWDYRYVLPINLISSLEETPVDTILHFSGKAKSVTKNAMTSLILYNKFSGGNIKFPGVESLRFLRNKCQIHERLLQVNFLLQ